MWSEIHYSSVTPDGNPFWAVDVTTGKHKLMRGLDFRPRAFGVNWRHSASVGMVWSRVALLDFVWCLLASFGVV